MKQIKKKTILFLIESGYPTENYNQLLNRIKFALKKQSDPFRIFLGENCIEVLPILSSISILEYPVEFAAKIIDAPEKAKVQADAFICEYPNRNHLERVIHPHIPLNSSTVQHVVLEPYSPFVPEEVAEFYEANKSVKNELYLAGWSEKMLEEMTDYDPMKKLLKPTEKKGIWRIDYETFMKRYNTPYQEN